MIEKFRYFTMLLDETHRLRGRIRDIPAAVYAESGLNEMEMTVLNAVAGATRPPTVPQIGRSLGHSRQVIQRSANSLVQQGLVEPLVNPDHKRATLLAITDSGLKVKGRADAIASSLALPLIAEIDPEMLKSCAEMLQDFRLKIEDNIRGRDRQS